MPRTDTMQKSTFSTVVQSAGNEPLVTISTAEIDREGDRLEPEGAELENYRKNPVILYAHNHQAIPIGAATEISVLPGVGLQARIRWLENDEFASRVRNAFDQGILRGASVGFIPLESEPLRETGGRRYTRWELVEFSIVPVPANAGAVRGLRSLGLATDKTHREPPRNRPRRPAGDLRAQVRLREDLETAESILEAVGKWAQRFSVGYWFTPAAEEARDDLRRAVEGRRDPRPAARQLEQALSAMRSAPPRRGEMTRGFEKLRRSSEREAKGAEFSALRRLDDDDRHALRLDDDEEIDVDPNEIKEAIASAIAEHLIRLTGHLGD